jgi:hypothetical protein
MTDLTIRFATREQAIAFSTWLCEAGEQDYWMWAEIQIRYPIRREPPKDYVAAFDYHNGGEGKDFMNDMTIRTRGVLVSEDDPPTEPTYCQYCKATGVANHTYPEPRCPNCEGSGLANIGAFKKTS